MRFPSKVKRGGAEMTVFSENYENNWSGKDRAAHRVAETGYRAEDPRHGGQAGATFKS
jgi:hypothetical protein